MSKLCPYCGKTLQDYDVFCDQCGNAQQPPVAAEYAAPMKAKQSKVKWWMIAVPAVLVVALAVALMWNTIAFAIAPEAVLAASASNTVEKLEKRWEGTPIGVMSNTAEAMKDGMYMAAAFDYVDDYTEHMTMEAEATMDMTNKRFALNGSLSAAGETLDVMLYMDAMCAAIGSDRITDGTYFGITYETFSDDLKDFYLYDEMDSQTVEELEMAVEMIQDYWTMLDQNQELANIEEYKAVLTEYYESMEMETGSEKIKIGGKERSCNTVTYNTTWGDFVDMYVDLLEVMADEPAFQSYMETYAGYYSTMYGYEIDPDDMADSMIDTFKSLDDYMDGDITVVFYLNKNAVAAMDLILVLEAEGEEVEILVDVMLGEDVSKDDIEITMELSGPGASYEFEMVCMKEVNGDSVSENLYLSGEGTEVEMEYVWNRDSGDLEINLDLAGNTFGGELVFQEIEDGFTVIVEDLSDLLPSDYELSGMDGSFSLTLAKGQEVSVPDYANIDAWTEDMINGVMENIESFG